MEVLHDLDVEAAQAGRRLGLPLARAATPGTHPRFVSMITELVRERAGGQPARAALGGMAPGPDDLPGRMLPSPGRRPRRGPAPGQRVRTPPRRQLLGLARAAAARGGPDAGRPPAAGPAGRPEVTGTKSSPTDVVTEMDRRVGGADHRAGCGRSGPATRSSARRAGSRGAAGSRWIIDPLDGTVNYLYGLADWAVSIAAEVEGTVVAGVVAVPAHGEVFTAVAGGGAWLQAGGRTAGPAALQHRGDAGAGAGGDRVRVRGRPARRSRARWSRPCCPGCATSAGAAPARWTCARSRRAAWTRSTSAA